VISVILVDAIEIPRWDATKKSKSGNGKKVCVDLPGIKELFEEVVR